MKRPVGSLLWFAGLLVIAAQLVGSGASSSAITFGSEITNGSDSYSSVISIWYSEDSESTPEFICSGTLIQSDVVLTAAHCVLSQGIYFVKFGVDQLDDESDLWGVSATWRNPQYSARQRVNDVGLLLLTEKNMDVKISALPSGNSLKSVQGNKAVKYEIVGWGRDQNRDRATYLHRAAVDDQTAFAKRIKAWAPWRNDVWFAVGKYISKQKVFAGACSGDSGGPLFAILNGKRYLAGVTSWGAEDCELGAPSVYSRLSYYADKIKTEGIPTLRINEVKQNRALPSVITGPSITGEAKSGSIVTCDPGEWSANTTDISISWSGPGVPYGSILADLKLPTVTSDSQFVCTVSATSSNGTIARTANIFLVGPPQELVKTLLSNFPDPTKYADSNPVTCTPGQFKGAQQVSVSWWVTGNGTEDVRLTTNSGPTFDLTKSLISKYGGRSLLCQVVAAGAGGTTQSNASKLISPWPKPQIKTGSATLKGISGSDPSYVGQLLTCESPTWTGGIDSQEYKFYISAYPDRILLSAGASLSLTKDAISKYTNRYILCEVSAANAGGATTATSESIMIREPVSGVGADCVPHPLVGVCLNQPKLVSSRVYEGPNAKEFWHTVTVTCIGDKSLIRNAILVFGLWGSSLPFICDTPQEFGSFSFYQSSVQAKISTPTNDNTSALLYLSTSVPTETSNTIREKATVSKPSITITSGSSQIVSIGTPIANTSISNVGGPVSYGGYSIAPSLPSGLTLNPTTGIITGTPGYSQLQTPYTLTAMGPGGSSSTFFTLTVNAAKPVLTISSGASQSVFLGTAIISTTVTNTGGPVVSGGYSITPALPAGLTLNRNSGVISGTPTSLQAQTTYLLTAIAQGVVSDPVTFSLSVTVVPPDQQPPVVIAGSGVLGKKAVPAGASITFTFSATDDVGVTSAGGIIYHGDVLVTQGGGGTLISGTAREGTWSVTLTIPTGNSAGTYRISAFAQDIKGNSSGYTFLAELSVEDQGSIAIAVEKLSDGSRIVRPTPSSPVPPGSNYTVRWVSNSDQLNTGGCTTMGAIYNWSARCETNYGIDYNPGGSASGYPDLDTFQLSPYSLNPDYFVFVYTNWGKKASVGYTMAKIGTGLALTIEAPDGRRWVSNWFDIK